MPNISGSAAKLHFSKLLISVRTKIFVLQSLKFYSKKFLIFYSILIFVNWVLKSLATKDREETRKEVKRFSFQSN